MTLDEWFELYNNGRLALYNSKQDALNNFISFTQNTNLSEPHLKKVLRYVPRITESLQGLNPTPLQASDAPYMANLNLENGEGEKYLNEQLNNYALQLNRANDLDVSNMIEGSQFFKELSEEELTKYLDILNNLSSNRRF